MGIRVWLTVMVLILLTACAPSASDETQLLQEEYATLSAEKKGLTEEMVQLNMAINEAESQNDEIIAELKELEVLRTEITEHIEDLEEVTDELSEEAEVLAAIVSARRELVNGWQLFHSAPKLVKAQADMNAEVEVFSEVIRVSLETATGLDWEDARCFVTNLSEREASVRVIMPVMDYGEGIWTGTEEDMHFFDYELTLTLSENGWYLDSSEIPEVY